MLSKQLIFVLAFLSLVSCSSEPSAAEYLERAREYEADGKLTAAVIETRNALKTDGENKAARLLLGLLQLRTGDPAGAEKELAKASELGAARAETLVAIARALKQQGKFDELRVLDVSNLPPVEKASVLASRAYAHLAGNDYAAARADADESLELDPSSTDAGLVFVRLDAMTGDLVQAKKRIHDTLDAVPENVEAWELLGDLDRAGSQFVEALASYDQAIERSDRALSARLKRAQVQLERGEDKLALADLDALTKAGVKLPGIELARGQIDLHEGELSEAQLRFEAALMIAPDYPAALGSLALTHLALGNLGQAEQYGKQMMAATDDSHSARRLLAAIRLENGRYALAAETVEPILRDIGNADAFSMRVMTTALLKQDKYDEAIEQMAALIPGLSEEALDAVASPLVLARAPSRELLDEVSGKVVAMKRDPGDDFLDMNDRRIVRILELLGRGENDKALEEAQALRASMPDSAVPHNLIGRVHVSAGRTDAARAAFERGLELDANNTSAQRFLAELDLQSGDIDVARARLEKALLGGEDSENLMLSLARLEAQAGDEAAMLEWLERARAEQAGSAEPILLLARYHASRAEHELALEELARLDERQRRQPIVLQLEGVALIALRRFRQAVERFDALVALQPRVAQWTYLRAQAQAGLNDNVAAIRDLEEALKLSPQHVPSLLAMTNIEIFRGEFDAAEARIDMLRDLIPGRSELDAVVSLLAERKAADPPNSGSSKQRIDSTEAALMAARDLWKKGDRDNAVVLLEKWLEGNPKDLTVRLTLGNTYSNLERFDEAIAQYETLLEGDLETLTKEARLSALNNLAWYLRDKDPARAAGYAERALDETPDSTATLDTLAMIRFGQGDNKAAKQAFDKAFAIGIDNPTILFHGAQIEAELGNDDAARELLKPLVADGVEFPEAEDAARLLDEIGQSGG